MRALPTAPALASALILASCSAPGSGPVLEGWGGVSRGYHQGPEVIISKAGTARFVEPFLAEFDRAAAMETVTMLDAWYREPGNDGYEASLDHLIASLRAAGFGVREGLELQVIETPMEVPAWTPLSASLTLFREDEPMLPLHQFRPGDDRERTMLPVNAPPCDLRGKVAMGIDNLGAGQVLVTQRPLEEVLHVARERGAVAVLSSHVFEFNVDPTDRERHLDAIHYGAVPAGTDMPVAHISPRIYTLLGDLGPSYMAQVELKAEVRFDQRPLRTLMATVVGAGRPEEEVVLMAHLQEPGTNDNATGVAGLLEGALTLVRARDEGSIPRPLRTISFVWGEEYASSTVFLEQTKRRVLAGIAVDMIGESREETGAICLLERGPDPGALWTLPPDEHTVWGEGAVDPDWILPSGLALIMRTALIDVGLAVDGWVSSEHPWEGGSDHDVFLEAGIPAALLWHFPDFTYHTNLDRLGMVDPQELERSAVAVLVAACGVADARPSDLKRYVDSLLHERYERQGIVFEQEAPEEAAAAWGEWSTGARRWVAFLCNGVAPPQAP